MWIAVTFGALSAACVVNGLSGLVLGKCISAPRKRAGQANWNALPRMIEGADARSHGTAFLALGLFVAYAMYRMLADSPSTGQ
jgi:hypothetical protein